MPAMPILVNLSKLAHVLHSCRAHWFPGSVARDQDNIGAWVVTSHVVAATKAISFITTCESVRVLVRVREAVHVAKSIRVNKVNYVTNHRLSYTADIVDQSYHITGIQLSIAAKF